MRRRASDNRYLHKDFHGVLGGGLAYLEETAGIFRIEMQHCPSKGRWLQIPQTAPYPHYCEHCDTLYRRVLEPLGYRYSIDLSRCDEARCGIVVTQQENEIETGETDA